MAYSFANNMWQFRDKLLQNSIQFMTEAVSDYRVASETDPDELSSRFIKNKSIVHAGTSVEHLLKEIILGHDWRQVFRNPNQASLACLKTGNMFSKGFKECVSYIEAESLLKKKHLRRFERLAKQRNKVVHMGQNIPINTVNALIRDCSESVVDYFQGDDELRELYSEELNDLSSWR